MLKNNILKSTFSIVLIIVMVFSCNLVSYASDINITPTSVNSDSMLLVSQKWLNENYSSNSAFGSVPEDGSSRRATVNGCIRALQIELGITATADNFGATTEARFNSRFPNGVVQQDYPSTEESNIYGIIQCALWTKGYSTGSSSITRHFYDGTGNAIINLKEDMGFISPNSTVTLNVMKGLLSMDYYVTVSGGSNQIRQIQQELNRTYPTYLKIIPCDGVYTRSMNKALIIVLQAIEGYDEEHATGNFGDGTKANLPLNFDNSSSWTQQYETYQKCIKLVQYALCCNGYGDRITLSNTQWNNSLSNVIKDFQKDMNIEQTGKMNVDTWMALLLSKGNPDRACVACDTRYEMTSDRLYYLKTRGIKVVGRYLTGSEKGLKDDEPARIILNGLKFFPIFQETLYADNVTKYNYNLGVSDVKKAVDRAKELKIPSGNIIYFAIDFDPTDDQIKSYVIPYFEGISKGIGDYKVGIYGTRNTCTQVMNQKYAVTCFVSDMSTGYSGNMGFKMPSNWNLDQYDEEKGLSSVDGAWDMDKVSYSKNFPVVERLDGDYYKWGSFSLVGKHTGNEFQPPEGAKKVRVHYLCSTEEHMTVLYLSILEHTIDEDGNSNFFNITTKNCNFIDSLEKDISTDWYDINYNLGYKLSYECKDESKPIGPFPDIGTEIYPTYEDGKCNITVYLEFSY